MGRVEGKVAVVSGAARGQGRSHAVRLAEEGADVIVLDICEDVATNGYPLSRTSDLDETVALVEKTGQKAFARQADVRDVAALAKVITDGVAEFGHLDVVVANAGICPLGNNDPQAWVDVVNVNLLGVINMVTASMPHLKEGASIIATGSLAAFLPGSVDTPGAGAGGAGYGFAKRTVAAYVHEAASALARKNIRINAVHPTNCNTNMLHSEPMYRAFRPDLEHPTLADVEEGLTTMASLPVGYVEPQDISNAVLYLASDEARYVTGLQMRVDAGGYVRHLPFHV
ncbi:MAG TPA: mycofactocin-coupled SDR family oxidoreductase [Mycobacteriales bacterium]|nr:mycofactocin-coupled SDR family oxidoreductase [Mycobacteriales bacterium]